MASVQGADIQAVQSSSQAIAKPVKAAPGNKRKSDKDFATYLSKKSEKESKPAVNELQNLSEGKDEISSSARLNTLFKITEGKQQKADVKKVRETALIDLTLRINDMNRLSGGEKSMIQKLLNPKENPETVTLVDSSDSSQSKDSLVKLKRFLESKITGHEGDSSEESLITAGLEKSLAELGKEQKSSSEHPKKANDPFSVIAGNSKGKSAKAEMTITVEDLRTKAAVQSHPSQKDFASALKQNHDDNPISARLTSSKEFTPREHNSQDHSVQQEKEFITEIKSPDGATYTPQGSGGKMEAPVVREAAQAFQQHMTRSGNADLVRNIKFVLKDNNAGEIKLILKPESLGNVRIHLNLNENNIVGRIVVDNNNVRDAFLNNMNQLNQMLKDNGFEASLDVFVGQQDQQDTQNPEEAMEDADAMKNLAALRSLDQAANVAVPEDALYHEGALNMVM